MKTLIFSTYVGQDPKESSLYLRRAMPEKLVSHQQKFVHYFIKNNPEITFRQFTWEELDVKSHADALDAVMKQEIGNFEHFIVLDIDCVPLSERFLTYMRQPDSLSGAAQVKIGTKPYISPILMGFSREVFKKLKTRFGSRLKPHKGTYLHDVGMGLTKAAYLRKVNVDMVYPTGCVRPQRFLEVGVIKYHDNSIKDPELRGYGLCTFFEDVAVHLGDARKESIDGSRSWDVYLSLKPGEVNRDLCKPNPESVIKIIYEDNRKVKSDINQHLAKLKVYSSYVNTVTEFGVSNARSTSAFLVGHPRKLTSYDKDNFESHESWKRCLIKTDFQFIQGDTLKIDIEPTDLLFIDSWHTYAQLSAELKRHADKVGRYIVLHDTETYKEIGEDKKKPGLWKAIEEFLASNKDWKMKEHNANNNGLTILSKTSTVIYTAIFGDYDNLYDPRYVPDHCDFVCFTDNKQLKSDVWGIRVVEPTHKDPNRAAKIYKILPHQYFPEYEKSIWIDGAVQLNSDVNCVVRDYLLDKNFVVLTHPSTRTCVYQEGQRCIDKKLGESELIEKQLETYRKAGLPEHNGLVWCGVLVRRHNLPEIKAFCDDWWKEICQFSRRDQISFPFVAFRHRLDFCKVSDAVRQHFFHWRKHNLCRK